MKQLTLLFITFLITIGLACGGSDTSETADSSDTQPKSMVEEPKEENSIAEGKGVGEVENVELTDPLEEDMIVIGESIYQMKCASCHKLTDQRVVGPGFQGITNRRKPEWIMNMITNVEVMLAEDPQAQKLLEECLTRMPNQNLTIGDARHVLEFMRKNDMERAGEKDGAVEG